VKNNYDEASSQCFGGKFRENEKKSVFVSTLGYRVLLLALTKNSYKFLHFSDRSLNSLIFQVSILLIKNDSHFE
jgi:hypothetical protein